MLLAVSRASFRRGNAWNPWRCPRRKGEYGHDVTPAQLLVLVNKLLEQGDEPNPYTFFLDDKEITTALSTLVDDLGMQTEAVLPITCAVTASAPRPMHPPPPPHRPPRPQHTRPRPFPRHAFVTGWKIGSLSPYVGWRCGVGRELGAEAEVDASSSGQQCRASVWNCNRLVFLCPGCFAPARR